MSLLKLSPNLATFKSIKFATYNLSNAKKNKIL